MEGIVLFNKSKNYSFYAGRRIKEIELLPGVNKLYIFRETANFL
jgi:hypothetical protein